MRVITYTYPDGNKSLRKPRDGEKFRYWNHVDQEEKVWQWDGYKEQWYDITLENAFDELLKIELEEDKCECGSEKVGSPGHSTWCKKWSRNS